jgi:hypothetical protein
MNFLTRARVAERFKGKSVAIVGSGPGVLGNAPGSVDSYDIVVRVNNYKLSRAAGFRTDVHYSFYGGSIKKTAADLKSDGVTLCLCKCPNSQPIESEWHKRNDKMNGVDFRAIYRRRREFWFTDTYIPETEDFLRWFDLLGRHVPTTGFAAILDILSFNPRAVYLTGFDFFVSKIHNVNEPWRERNTDQVDPDPIRHVPEQELAWLRRNYGKHPITVDSKLHHMLMVRAAA